MDKIPDCTLVSACFCVHDENPSSLSMAEIQKKSEPLLKMPCFLVLHGDKHTIPYLKETREKFGLLEYTKFVQVELSELWTYQYKEKVNENRAKYWPTNDPRAQTDSHLINCNKCDLVLKIIETNPFQTTKFGWIDCFLHENAKKLCENYQPNKILYVLNNLTDKFHIQILNVCDKKYKLPENKREYYECYQWIMCGCFFTCGKETGIKILNRLKEIFVQTTEAGYGHGDEMLFLEILDEFYDDIERSYGDYGQLLNNFVEQRENTHYIYYLILHKYVKYGYFKEGYECASKLLKEIETFKIDVGWTIYMYILADYLVCVKNHIPAKWEETREYILKVCSVNPYMQKEYNQHKSHYDSLLGM
jgi:hypothetical protein